MVYSAKCNSNDEFKSFTRKKQLTISTNGTSTPINYEYKIDLLYELAMDIDFEDICFNSLSGDFIPYFISHNVDSTSAEIWVKIPVVLTHPESYDIIMFYGSSNTINTSSIKVFDIISDDFENKCVEWDRSPSNPTLSPETPNVLATWGSVWVEGSVYHMYYTCSNGSYHKICHATSSDGLSWTKDTVNNPVLDVGTSGQWDEYRVWCPQVWKEGTTWYMMYAGDNTSIAIQGGLATSSDGITWTKSPSNPVMPGGTLTNQCETWGIIKSGITYYMYYGTVTPPRQYGVATSTDLVNWTKDPAGYIFTGGRFCPDVFKYNGKFYILIPHYTSGTNYSEFELYEDDNPTFYLEDRKFIGVKKTIDTNIPWENEDEDTPWFLCDDIYKTYETGDQLRCYYGGANTSDVWCMGLLTVDDVADAIVGDGGWVKTTPTSTAIDLDTSIAYQETSLRFTDNNTSDGPGYSNTFNNQTMGIIECMIRATTSGSSGTQNNDMYIYENDVLKITVGLNAGTMRFHYWNGGFVDTLDTYSVDTWYNLIIEFNCNTNTFNFIVKNTSGTIISQTNDISFPSSTNLNKINLITTSGFQGNVWWDNVIIRKYISDTPTNNVNNEQHQRRTCCFF